MPDGEVRKLNFREEDIGNQASEKKPHATKSGHLSRDRPGDYFYPRMTPEQIVNTLNNLPDGTVLEVYFNHDD